MPPSTSPPRALLDGLSADAVRRLPPTARYGLLAGASVAFWAIAHVVLDRGVPLGIVLLGAVMGALYGLVAVGIVLVHRSSRIVNFAQAELGSLAAVVTIYLVVHRGQSYWVAIAVGLLLAAACGALLDIAILRRFKEAPRLILTVVTIGLAQVLNGISILLALLFGRSDPVAEMTTPFSVRFDLFPVVFRGDHLLVLLVVPLLLFALGAFLRRSSYGVAVRAAADSGERAELLGIPVARLSTLVWMLAAVLSAVGIILRVPVTGFVAYSAVSGGGTALLLRALTAAVIARMDNLVVASVAAILLGIVEQTAAWTWGNTVYVDAFLVLVILLSLAVQKGGFSRVAEGQLATSRWRAVREVRPVPAELRLLPEVRWATVVGRVMVIAGLVCLPLVLSPSRIQLAALVLIYSMVAVSLVVLTGWAGQISLGHWALVGVGGTVTTLLHGRHGWDLLLAVAGGVAVTAVVSLLIGLPALRMRGPFLAVTTLGFAVTSATFLLNPKYLPWLAGDSIARPDLLGRLPLERDWQLYQLALVCLVLVIGGVVALRRSRSGRALIALRDNEPAAQAVAVPTTRMKLAAFALSGAIAGLAGSLYALHQGGIRSDAFDPVVSLRIFSMVVIGGLGSIPGAVLGAGYIRGAEFFLPPGWALVASGAGIVVLLMVLPGGLGEVVYRLRDWALRWVAARRAIVVPSLLADQADESSPTPVSGDVTRPRELPEGVDALLEVRGLDVAYDKVQVLFGVDLAIAEGEMVALLGTNGAGKSTLLRAVSGLTPPVGGRVNYGDQDVTGQRPTRAADRGIVLMPGGRGVFPTLTVADNLRVAGWLQRKDADVLEAAIDEAVGRFPALRARWDSPAGNLSGGEQQMLSLAMVLLGKPRLLLLDELTLGLAPTIVDDLLEVVREVHAAGTTVLLVEQSVNTALKLADRAVFMEKGEVRFSGPTAELLERPDVLRSVFLEGAASRNASDPAIDEGAEAEGLAVTMTTVEEPTSEHRDAEVLRVRDLTRRYGGITAVDDVSLELRDGEILGLIGPNGAGKTTLFDLISGFVIPDQGSVELHGVDVSALAAHRRAAAGMGRVFQDARLWGSLTVAEAIAVARERHVDAPAMLPAFMGLPLVAESEAAVTRTVEELIEAFGLGAFRDKFVSELSTGSRRVVEIAAQLAHRPSVLLLDEPSSGIAQRETEQLVPLLRRVRNDLGASILVIDHDMPLISRLADRIVALDQGRVIAAGTPSEVLRHPEVVASYLGSQAEELRAAGSQLGPLPVIAGGS